MFRYKQKTALRGAAAWRRKIRGEGRITLNTRGAVWTKGKWWGLALYAWKMITTGGKRRGTGREDEGKGGTRTGTRRKKNRYICTDTHGYPVKDATL
jgi:hypothetical protein